MVSTDDDEIAGIALSKGANVPFMRSEKNSDDNATTPDVFQGTALGRCLLPIPGEPVIHTAEHKHKDPEGAFGRPDIARKALFDGAVGRRGHPARHGARGKMPLGALAQ